MRRPWLALLAVALLAGCSPAASATGTPAAPSPTVAASAAPTLEPSPSEAPIDTPFASPTYGPCPTSSPMSVAEYTAADPTCFGTNDVTLTGWEDIPTGIGDPEGDSHVEPSWLDGNYPTPSILVDRLPEECPDGPEICEPFLWVHVDPASKLSFERDGVYVVITGHRQDPRALTCTRYPLYSPAPSPTTGDATADCIDAFVLTSVRDVDPPATFAAICPTDAVLTPYTYPADPACFHGKTLRILGWVDDGPLISDPGWPIDPAWLVPSGLALWSQKPVVSGGDGECPQDGVTCGWMWLQVNPTSGPAIPLHRWVIVTGHIDDPTAETCHFRPGAGFEAVYARQSCRSAFVVTKVQVTTAPSG